MAKIAVVGSRDTGFAKTYWRLVSDVVARLPEGTVLVSGAAKGVDTIAARVARRGGLPVIEIKPDYDTYAPKTAPLVRNSLIAQECDGMIAFWDAKSGGTEDVVKKARRLGKPVWVWTPPAAGG